MNSFIKLKEVILDIFFPPLCLGCQSVLMKTSDKTICEQCKEKIFLHTTLFCPVCKLRLANNKKVCRHGRYLLAAATNYDTDAIRNLIRFFKYKKWSRLEKPLGEILIKYLDSISYKLKAKSYLAIPIPLSKDRLQERGFNQSLLLAKIAADFYKLTLIENALTRKKDTKTQADLKDYDERKENVKNCFAVENSDLIKGKNLILVDDVFTSGATMDEAVKTLRSAGARKIIALVVAKAR